MKHRVCGTLPQVRFILCVCVCCERVHEFISAVCMRCVLCIHGHTHRHTAGPGGENMKNARFNQIARSEHVVERAATAKTNAQERERAGSPEFKS